MNPNDILAYFEGRREAMIGEMRQIVDIESPSYDVQQSRVIAERIAALALEIPRDLKIERLAAEKFGEHLIIRAFPGDQKPTLLLGHTDTVHPVGTTEKNPTRIEGERFYGCGIFDMKANIVLMLAALRFFAETGTEPCRPITIVLSCDEEVGSRTGRPLIEREAANVENCLVFEPSFEGKVKTCRKGTGMFKLCAHGVPAHAGLEPEKGASAILELSRQIDKLHELNDQAIGTTVNVCTVKGGTTTNVIPEYAECDIDVRFSTLDEAKRIERTLNELKPFDQRVTLRLTGEINRPPLERTAEVAALYEKARDLAASFGYELEESQVGGGSDGNFVAALGVPVLDGLGIRGDGAHTLHEHILISDIAVRAALTVSLLAKE
jgi:glutamate carboxypeptidase